MLQHLFREGGVLLVALATTLTTVETARAQLKGSIGQVVPSSPNPYAPSFAFPATTSFVPENPVKIAISYPEYYSTRLPGSAGAYDPTPWVRRSSYGPTAADVSAGSGPAARGAEIDVRLPAAADLWFEGVRTAQTGTYRQFMSPPLAPGRDYAYQVRASWKEGGREVSKTRRVRVRAGDRLDVDFLTPALTSPP